MEDFVNDMTVTKPITAQGNSLCIIITRECAQMNIKKDDIVEAHIVVKKRKQ